MKLHDRWNYLKRAGGLTWDILVRGQYDFTYDLMSVHSHLPVRKRLNLLRTGANLIYRRTSPWGWPIHMHVELTSYCNLRCRVCPTGTGRLERQPQAIDPALFKRVMDEAGPYLLTASLWGWGEPLLHPRLADVLSQVQDRGVTTLLSTNGQNLEDEGVLRALASYPPTYLIVCLDGLTDETNSAFRVGAKLRPALEGVERLAEMRREAGSGLPILHMRYIVTRFNEHEVPEIPRFAADNHFDVLSIRTLSIIDAPEDAHRDLVPESEELRAYGYEDGERVIRSDFVCEKAFTFPAVFADGTVVACDQDCNASRSIGHLGDNTSFADIWWGETAAQVRKDIRDNPGRLSFCSNCPFRDRPVSTCSIQYLDLRQ